MVTPVYANLGDDGRQIIFDYPGDERPSGQPAWESSDETTAMSATFSSPFTAIWLKVSLIFPVAETGSGLP